MNEVVDRLHSVTAASVYFADIAVHCSLERAWLALLDYQAWNPHFLGSKVTPICGMRGCEGEVVLIKDNSPYVTGEAPPEFYAETIKVLAPRRIVWRVYPTQGRAFCNFVDFGLSETSAADVRFAVSYYEQLVLPADLLESHRTESETIYRQLALAFKAHCETRSAGTDEVAT